MEVCAKDGDAGFLLALVGVDLVVDLSLGPRERVKNVGTDICLGPKSSSSSSSSSSSASLGMTIHAPHFPPFRIVYNSHICRILSVCLAVSVCFCSVPPPLPPPSLPTRLSLSLSSAPPPVSLSLSLNPSLCQRSYSVTLPLFDKTRFRRFFSFCPKRHTSDTNTVAV